MDGVERFRFRVDTAAYVAWTAAPSVVVFLAVVAVIRQQLDAQAAVFFSVCLSWYIVLGTMYMMQNATLIVSQSGLERLVLGTRLRRLDWRDVRRIRQFVLYSRPSGGNVIWIKVDAMNQPIWKRLFFRSITFPSRTDDFPQLIRTLNTYASRYNVKIVQKTKGAWNPSTKLSDRVEDFE